MKKSRFSRIGRYNQGGESISKSISRNVTRRHFVQTGAAGSLALTSLGFVRMAKAQAAKPNIVFIMADDLG